MVRAVLGFFVAVVLWMATLVALTFSIAFLWPAYAVHGRTWFKSGVMHLYLEWPTFPWWYNVGVAGLAAPAVLLGGKMARRFRATSVAGCRRLAARTQQ